MFAVGAYWIFERDNAIALVQSLVPRQHRRVTRDTWVLIDMKLGAFVRGEFLLVAFVASLLSLAFWLDGEPYWLLRRHVRGDRRARARSSGRSPPASSRSASG